MSIDDLTGRINSQFPDGNNQPVSATSNKISDSISGIDNLPGFEKFKNMLTLQPAITGHNLDIEIEGKKIYAHLATFRDYLLSPEFIDRVSKNNGTFDDFVNKLEGLKPQIDRVSVGSEGVVDGSRMNDLVTEQSYTDFKLMYNGLRGLFKGIINPANGKADTDRLTIIALVALKGLPMLGDLINDHYKDKLDENGDHVQFRRSAKIGRYGSFAISPFIENAPKGVDVGVTAGKKTHVILDSDVGPRLLPIQSTLLNNTDLSGEDKMTREAVRYVTYEIGAVTGDIICKVLTTHYSSSSGAILRMK